MGRILTAFAAASIAAIASAQAADEFVCKLCSEAQERAPIDITIESGINFSRFALINHGDGEAEIDPVTGEKRARSNLLDLGGLAFEGKARVTGTPLQSVRIELPKSVTLTSPAGAEAELVDFVTDLTDSPMLDENGNLEFSFGAVLRTKKGKFGDFRGRFPIRVDYN
jgi:hypothetical protein